MSFLISFFVDKIVDYYIMSGTIDEEDRDVYEYSVMCIIENLVFGIFILVSGIILNAIIEGIVFIVILFLLRKSSGGAHAKTAELCSVISCITFILAVVTIKALVYAHMLYVWVACVVVGIMVFGLSPVDSVNLRYSRVEKNKLKLITGILIFLLLIISWITRDICCAIIMRCVLTSCTIMLISLLIGIVNNMQGGENDAE